LYVAFRQLPLGWLIGGERDARVRVVIHDRVSSSSIWMKAG
jgi:hypothetical protein